MKNFVPHNLVVCYNTYMGIEFTASAAKHGISQDDALYAMSNAQYQSNNVKVAGNLARHPRMVFVGPQHPQTDRLIEVLIELKGDSFVIYHVMPLGSYYRNQMEQDTT